MQLADLRSRRVGVLMSGGLSCTAMGLWLAENGVPSVCFVADIGQRVPFAPAELADLLHEHGLEAQIVDLRTELAELCLNLVKYQATYEGGYWNTTSGSRATLVAGLADPLRAAGCTVLAHGCVAGGNDEGRFARYTAGLAPDLTVFTPWAQDWLLDRFPDRRSMWDYLAARGFPAEFARFTGYSIDGNLGGFSHDGDDLEQLSAPVPMVEPLMTRWPSAAPDEAETIRVRFATGCPVEINGGSLSAVRCVESANEIGGRNGISMHTTVENRVNGTKCRGVYEAPGLEVLGRCLAALYQVTLDKAATDLLHALSYRIGRAAYEGRLFDTATTAARAAADLLAGNATGTVRASLYKGSIIVNELHPEGCTPGVVQQTRFRHGGHRWHTELQPV